MIDCGRLNVEHPRLSSCKMLGTDAITLTVNAASIITVLYSRTKAEQMGTVFLSVSQ